MKSPVIFATIFPLAVLSWNKVIVDCTPNQHYCGNNVDGILENQSDVEKIARNGGIGGSDPKYYLFRCNRPKPDYRPKLEISKFCEYGCMTSQADEGDYCIQQTAEWFVKSIIEEVKKENL